MDLLFPGMTEGSSDPEKASAGRLTWKGRLPSLQRLSNIMKMPQVAGGGQQREWQESFCFWALGSSPEKPFSLLKGFFSSFANHLTSTGNL